MSAVEKKTNQSSFKAKNMLLVDGVMMHESKPIANFVGIPMSDDCPFIELVFDTANQVLGIISKHIKPQFHFVPRVDENGLPVMVKNKALQASQPYQQQRVQIDTYHEYYIRDIKQIEEFLDMYVYNSNFDYKKYFK